MTTSRFVPLLLLAMTGTPAAAQQAAASAATLRPVTLTYQLLMAGSPVGTATSTLTQEGDVWISATALDGPMTQRGELRFRNDFTPISARHELSQGPVSGIRTELLYADGRVTGSATLPPAMGGVRPIDSPAEPGTLLPEMDTWYLAAAGLAPGSSFELPIFNVMTGGVVRVTYRVAAAESVTVPAGTFETYRVEVSGGPQPIHVWVARDAPHLAVKQEYPGQPVTVVLQAMK